MTMPGQHERPDCARQRRRKTLQSIVWQYSGSRTLDWMAAEYQRRTGQAISASTILHIVWSQWCAPTKDQGYVTARQAAVRLGYTPQWVSHLCRTGQMAARRNPTSAFSGRRWWLISERSLRAYIQRKGMKRERVRQDGSHAA